MKKFLIYFSMAIAIIFPILFFAGCGVVPTAWVYFKMPGGYTTYTSDQYGITSAHIYYFENEADKNDATNAAITIYFSPRIMGADDMVVDSETVRGTTVDVSSYVDITIYVKTDSTIYAPAKKFYINGDEAVLTNSSESGPLAYYLIQNAPLLRGNPNGKIDGTVNIIEYR